MGGDGNRGDGNRGNGDRMGGTAAGPRCTAQETAATQSLPRMGGGTPPPATDPLERAAEGRAIIRETRAQGISLREWCRRNGVSKSLGSFLVQLARAEAAGTDLSQYPSFRKAVAGQRQKRVQRDAEEQARRHEAGLVTGESTGENLRPNPYEPPR